MKSMRITLTILGVLALALAWAGPASADSHWTCSQIGRPGSGLVCGELGHATTDVRKTCIYPLTGNAPDVGPFPCAKYRHYVRTDHRAIFRPDPLSPYSERTNFGFGQELGAGSGGGNSAAPKAAEATGVSWVAEIEAR